MQPTLTSTPKVSATNPSTVLTDTENTQKSFKETSYLLLQKSAGTLYSGLNKHELKFVFQKQVKGKLIIVSGKPDRQNPDDYKVFSNPGPEGSSRPLPEGKYRINKPVPDGKPAIGPFWIALAPNPLPRGDFGIHLDGDRDRFPGTAGCVGLPTQADLETVVSWFADPATKPEYLYVDWNFGTLSSETKITAKSLFDDVVFSTPESIKSRLDPVTGDVLN